MELSLSEMNYSAPWIQLGFQDASSLIMEEISKLHDYVNFMLLFVISLVTWVMYAMIVNKNINRYFLEAQKLEFMWTLFPAFILILIAAPSIITLYMIDEAAETNLTIKAVAHQWYWSYEYTDFYSSNMEKNIAFDSYMIPESQEEFGLSSFRMIDVDNQMVVPHNVNVRMIITSADVLHCWAVPAMGVKVDAIPGRLNQTQFITTRPGFFFGYCSEICGANHSFMPICMEVISSLKFLLWVMAQEMKADN